jgi:hypothetical protein
MIAIVLLLIYGISMIGTVLLWRFDATTREEMAFSHKLWFKISVAPGINTGFLTAVIVVFLHEYLMRGLNRLKDPKTEEP